MKKIIAAISAAVVLILPTLSASALEQPESMLVMGDSISTGYGLYAYSAGNNYNTDSYANLLAADLELSQQSQYKNRAIDGQTSGELLEAINSGEYDEDLQSELLVMSIGGNDVLGEFLTFLKESVGLDLIDISGATINADFTNPELMAKLNELLTTVDTSIAEFSNNFSELLDVIYEKSGGVYLVVQNVYNPLACLPVEETVLNMFDNKVKILNNTLSHCVELANTSHGNFAEVADIYSAFSGKTDDYTNMLSADIHPSAAGHEVIFETIKELVGAHDFSSAEAETTEPETEAANANAKLDDVSRTESTSVLMLCGFVIAFAVCVGCCLIIYFRRRKKR